MRHRGTLVKVVITLILAVLYVWAVNSTERHAADGRCEALKVWYDGYNEAYFGGSLPSDVLIGYSGENSYDSATVKTAGRFHIMFNPKKTSSPIYAHLILLHEACHIKTWDEFDEHGKKWDACMQTLYDNGAFRRELINQFTERK